MRSKNASATPGDRLLDPVERGLAAFLGRFVAFVPAVMPFLAGALHVRYRRFLAFNAAGGLVWGIGSVLLGYLAGNSYATVEKTFGRDAALAVAAIVVIGLIIWSILRHRREAARDPHTSDSLKS